MNVVGMAYGLLMVGLIVAPIVCALVEVVRRVVVSPTAWDAKCEQDWNDETMAGR